MPVTLLFKKENSPGFRESYIHVEWGPRHQLFSSKHTHKHCLLADAHTVLHAHMQMHAWPDNIAVAGDIYVCSLRIHQRRHHLFLCSLSLSSPLRQDGFNKNLFKCDIYTSCFVLLFEPLAPQKTSNVSLTALENSPESVSVLSNIALQSDIVIQIGLDINWPSKFILIFQTIDPWLFIERGQLFVLAAEMTTVASRFFQIVH